MPCWAKWARATPLDGGHFSVIVLKMKHFLIVAGTLFAAPAVAAPAASPLAGQWTNPKHVVTVRIAACGHGAYCGRVTAASVKAKADALKGSGRPLIGTELMRDFRPDGAGGWRGTLYIPDARQTANATMRLVGRNSIEVKGCGLGGLVCKTQTWTRVAAKRR